MALDLVNYEKQAREAVMAFWGNREQARAKQAATGKLDQGERAGVTGGKNMDGFVALVVDLANANGLTQAVVHRKRGLLTLPGYFRPTKIWDLLVFQDRELVAAIEFKSHVGPSFGKNFNNRAEEAIGMGHDFEIAFREGALGQQPAPFVGWMMLVEDAPKSRSAVNDKAPFSGVG